VLHVRCGTEEVERAVVTPKACEEQDARAEGGVLPVTQAGVAVGARDRLTLPVDEIATDRVVAVAGGGGELAGGLVEGEGEEVGASFFRPVDAGLPGGDLGSLADREGRENLEAGVAGMDLEGDVRVGGERRGEVLDAGREDVEEGAKLGANLGVAPEKRA
jgi:hypothetical protein